MEAILVNYAYDPEWLTRYDFTTTLYDRSDDGIERDLTKYGKVYKTPNMGDVDHDKLTYLVENYDNLPDTFIWGKSNLLKYVDEAYLQEKIKDNKFAPLLKFDHKTYSDKFGVVCKYESGIYNERADGWYFNSPALASKNFQTWGHWATYFRLPLKGFIPFPPGGNFLLTRDKVHKHSRDLYGEMRDILPYAMHPAEAHAAERSYYLLWQ